VSVAKRTQEKVQHTHTHTHTLTLTLTPIHTHTHTEQRIEQGEKDASESACTRWEGGSEYRWWVEHRKTLQTHVMAHLLQSL
jgi:hypothetical protein